MPSDEPQVSVEKRAVEGTPRARTAFLSYASQDAEAAARICEALRAAGVDVWHDQSALRGGDAWDAQIKKQIHDCSLFIPVISAHTNERSEGYFRREWNLATRRLLDMAHDTVFVVPVVVDETREPDARVPEEFLGAHWTRLPGGETPPAFAHRVRQLLETGGASATRVQAPTSREPLRNRRTPVRMAAVGVAALATALAVGWGIREWVTRGDADPPADVPLSAVELPARSVAVLAFENRGGSEGSGILAEGIPETVLHQLGLVPGLTVIARGSSFAFRGRNEDLRSIGRKLNVRYLLEGSVQAAGNRLRVTSTLVDAQSGASVWSEQFNPKLEDVFAVQDEIALAVARAMRLTLDAANHPAAGPRSGGTGNYDAYFEFLRGRALLASVRVSDLPVAIDALTAAIRRDPEFAPSYVLLARAKVLRAEQHAGGKLTEEFTATVASAVALLNEALVLDPTSGDAYVERGYLQLFFDVAAADADFRRGLELAPNYARGYEGLAAVLFQSVARRREALEMVDMARRLDPLALHLDVLKATYLQWGPGAFAEAAQLAESVVERDPLFVPALARLADIRWGGQGRHADAIALGEQMVALDPANETAWRNLALYYLSIGDTASARAALSHTSDHPALGPMLIHLNRNEWREAGEAAYALVADGPTYSQTEAQISLAIRRHARVTGDYQRAVDALERWASVTWDDGEPVLEGQLDMGVGVAGLADMLMAAGEHERARRILRELLANADLQVQRFGRGEIWLNSGRALAYGLLDRPDDAMAVLQRQAQLGFLNNAWRVFMKDEPVFDPLRPRKDFQKLLEEQQAMEAREREQVSRMRVDGRIPDRSAAS